MSELAVKVIREEVQNLKQKYYQQQIGVDKFISGVEVLDDILFRLGYEMSYNEMYDKNYPYEEE